MKYSNLFITLLLLVATLAGCMVPPAAPAAPADNTATAATTDTAFPVTLEHKYGSTTITARPQRIVTVGLTDHDALLALGIAPVGTTEWFGGYPGSIWPWAQDELAALGGATPAAVGGESLNIEKIAALQPDLILGLYAGITQEQYDLLSQIAPTVAQPAGYVDYGIPWQELTLTVGKAVGEQAKAEELIAAVEAQFAQVRADHPEFTAATAVATMAWQGIYVYGSQDVRSRLLTTLGFTLPAGLDEIAADTFGGNLSLERADLLNTDVIIWIDPQEAEGELGGPVYQSLPVHTEGREVLLSSYDELAIGGATSFVSVLSLPYLLDNLTPMLVAALDGDPATAVVAPAAPATEQTTAAPTTSDCAAGLRRFDHELLATDPVCIPADPQRIIALDMASVELTLLTDKTLLAASNWILGELPLLEPQFAERLAGVEDVGYPANLEKVLLLKPDLILAVGGTSVGDTIDIEKALEIAPVVIADPVIYDDWKLGTQFWSDVLNVTDFYAEMEQNYDARVAELQAALGQPSELEVSVIGASTYGVYLWMPDTPPGAILADVGLARPAAQSPTGDESITRYAAKQYVPISEERLDLADGDAIFYFTYASTDPATAEKENAFISDFTAKPLWQALNGVKAGKAFLVPGYWWRSQTYLLANKVVDDLFVRLTDTVATTSVLSGE